MDSLSQLALGAAVGVAVMGRRTAVWKAALAGGIAGTLPDLDVFIDHGDPVSNMTLHRTWTHALFWLTLAAPVLAAVAARLDGGRARFGRWWLALCLALVTHPLLDAMTVYGTQLLVPFSDHPFGVGSIFIIDPLYTVPLLVGLIAVLAGARLRWNAAGLALSCAYLAWSALAQHWVRTDALAQLRTQGIAHEQLLVTPAPFNTLLWRVVAMTPDGYHEGFRSLLDGSRPMVFDRFERRADLRAALAGHPPLERIAWFSRGFWKMSGRDGQVVISDLRMGQEPFYVFAFGVGRKASPIEPVTPPVAAGGHGDARAGLAWVWRRMWGEAVSPPR